MNTTEGRRVVPGHAITWFVYATDGVRVEKLRHTSKMAGGWYAWDAECECGWESRTGGAIKSSVERDVRSHKCDVSGDWRML